MHDKFPVESAQDGLEFCHSDRERVKFGYSESKVKVVHHKQKLLAMCDQNSHLRKEVKDTFTCAKDFQILFSITVHP